KEVEAIWRVKKLRSSIFRHVSFLLPSFLRPIAMLMIGGSLVTALKNENGARLHVLFPLSLKTQATGRGTIVCTNVLYAVKESLVAKSICIINSLFPKSKLIPAKLLILV